MIAEQMGPSAIRYDEIYYPRTDKRAISKYNISLNLPNSGELVHLRGQLISEDSITANSSARMYQYNNLESGDWKVSHRVHQLNLKS